MKIEYLPSSSLLPEQPVEIEVADGDWPGLYRTTVQSVAGKDITLHAPVRDGVYVPLRTGTALVVRAMSSQGVASFDSRVVERRVGAHPVVLVARPARLMVVQRRAFYRVRTQIPVLFARTEASRAEGGGEAGVLVNLSGGGGALRSALPLRADEGLRVRLPLGDKNGDLLLAARVIDIDTRRARRDTERVARLQWSGLSDQDENRLLRLVRTLERGRLRERRAFWDL